MNTLCFLVAAGSLLIDAANPLWPADLETGQVLDWKHLDDASEALEGVPFLSYLREVHPFRLRFHTTEDAKTFLERHVRMIRLGDHAASLALYTAFAEETSFRERDDGVLEIREFPGMNVSSLIVRDMLDELMAAVVMKPDGSFSGTGALVVDTGSESNTRTITINFDTGEMEPQLEVIDRLGDTHAITTADVAELISMHLPLETLDPSSIGIFVSMPDMPTIRHELLHALYAADPGYRAATRALAGAATLEQREYAVLFAAINYDVFDPDMALRNPDIVLDEAFNAYLHEGRFDPASGYSWFSLGDFVRSQDISLSLRPYTRIAEIPVEPETHAVLSALYSHLRTLEPGLTEDEFLTRHVERVLDNLHCLRLLHALVRQQHPGLHERVVQTRRILIDEQL